MKKTILFIIIFILLISLSLIFYYKSDYYAESNRDKFIKEYRAKKGRCINEGVYENTHPKFYYRNVVDEFGRHHSETVNLGETRIEISFTSDKLTLLNKVDNVIEEINFNGKYVMEKISDDECNYYLYIDKWVLKNYSTNEKIASFNNEEYIKLCIKLGENSSIWSNCGFRSAFYFRNKTNLDCPEEVVTLDLDKKLYDYDPEFNRAFPKYVEEAKYPSSIYDIERYR